jgi:deoxyribodipyrimidine photolyase-like uncharacterized protein
VTYFTTGDEYSPFDRIYFDFLEKKSDKRTKL